MPVTWVRNRFPPAGPLEAVTASVVAVGYLELFAKESEGALCRSGNAASACLRHLSCAVGRFTAK